MSSPRLHPCPHCGSADVGLLNRSGDGTFVHCRTCGARGPSVRRDTYAETEKPAAEAWNARHAGADQAVRLKALEDARALGYADGTVASAVHLRAVAVELECVRRTRADVEGRLAVAIVDLEEARHRLGVGVHPGGRAIRLALLAWDQMVIDASLAPTAGATDEWRRARFRARLEHAHASESGPTEEGIRATQDARLAVAVATAQRSRVVDRLRSEMPQALLTAALDALTTPSIERVVEVAIVVASNTPTAGPHVAAVLEEHAERPRYEESARDLAETSAALHPTGRCACHGEGTCDWCRSRPPLDGELSPLDGELSARSRTYLETLQLTGPRAVTRAKRTPSWRRVVDPLIEAGLVEEVDGAAGREDRITQLGVDTLKKLGEPT